MKHNRNIVLFLKSNNYSPTLLYGLVMGVGGGLSLSFEIEIGDGQNPGCQMTSEFIHEEISILFCSEKLYGGGGGGW